MNKGYTEYGAVYVITCLPTGQQYVGATRGAIRRRWYQHYDYAYNRKGSSKLSLAIREHGRENFSIQVLEYCLTQTELNACEARWIAELRTLSIGLNHTATGRQGANKGTVRKPESNAKQAEKMRGRTMAPEVRARISAAMRGCTLSEEHKQNLRKPKRGKTS